MAANNFDFGIVGAGIVGLAMANRIRQVHPNATIAVFDKEKSVGEHASGRNSGVLHAGFYYSPDSLKAELTRDGNKLLREFCAEEDVQVKETGKVVVSQILLKFLHCKNCIVVAIPMGWSLNLLHLIDLRN